MAYRNLPVVSYSCAAALLSNSVKFPTFTRTVGPANILAPMFSQLFSKFGWVSNIGVQDKTVIRLSCPYYESSFMAVSLYCSVPLGLVYQPRASCQIPKIAGCACAENAANVFHAINFKVKLLVNDPGVHHGTCVTHVPWCMSESLTHGGGENVPGIPGACATRNFTYLARGPYHTSTTMSCLVFCSLCYRSE